jgi:hypothetical protein
VDSAKKRCPQLHRTNQNKAIYRCIFQATRDSNEADLAYNAAHAFALAALRWNGYRPENRYVVFQVLPHTLGLDAKIWRVLAKCHNQRNLAEYEGHSEVDEQLLTDLIRCTTHLEAAAATLDPPAKA